MPSAPSFSPLSDASARRKESRPCRSVRPIRRGNGPLGPLRRVCRPGHSGSARRRTASARGHQRAHLDGRPAPSRGAIAPLPPFRHRLFTYGGNGYVAGSPNMANSIVHGNQVFVPDPGCSLFRDALSGDGFRFVGGPAFWSMYHCLEGELHCGSETERTIPSSPEWWYKTRFSCWPFGGMK